MVTTTAEGVAAEIERRFPAQVAAQRAADRSVVRCGGWSNIEEEQWPRAVREVVGPAVTVPDLDVHTDVAYIDASDLGSFADGVRVTGVLVSVWGSGTAERTGEPDVGSGLPVVESEGWVRALLGPDWAEQGYFFRCSGGEFDHIHYAVVLVDREGRVLPAPEDFFFPAIPGGWGIATVPEGTGQVAVRSLRRDEHGRPAPETVVASTPPESLRWQVELTGNGPDDIQAGARALLKELRPKGAIGHDVRLVSVRLDGQDAVIGFERRTTGTYSEQRVTVPTDLDLSTPTDFFRRTIPRLPYVPRDAQDWAGEIRMVLRELCATGYLGWDYDHPEPGRVE
ncbi:hypothetical protein NDR87_35105 [Nocardia sp. CDC159]|uniref:Uncharacterized protein n=1 Tax=Nocardia pulmonis TaxID=2951408 RepID=A0A9X2J0M2_9NOCA|nr:MULTISPECIES: hypothetical protein [Nocardia]MCM6778718.1 hypothetical protein [Nocardia pulmonis]MCM6791607.1 hypothetical protein [Nocardia sp. CDC159]